MQLSGECVVSMYVAFSSIPSTERDGGGDTTHTDTETNKTLKCLGWFCPKARAGQSQNSAFVKQSRERCK